VVPRASCLIVLTSGTGALDQGRFKSFPIQEDDHVLRVCRYVERNPLRAGLVDRAVAWPWSGVGRDGAARLHAALVPWPVARPTHWAALIDLPENEKELESLRPSIRRGRPYGSDAWTEKTAADLGLGSTLRPLDRPRKRELKRITTSDTPDPLFSFFPPRATRPFIVKCRWLLVTQQTCLSPLFPRCADMAPVQARRRLQARGNFGAQSHGFGTCCLRFVRGSPHQDARLASGCWPSSPRRD